MIRQATLMVWANPWHALDHMGRPSGHCPKERTGSTPGHAGYVGCTCVASAPTKVEDGSGASPDQDTCWHFDREPQKVPDNAYYRSAIRTGELFAADEKSAKRACSTDVQVTFVPLEEALAASKAAAVDKWFACFRENPPETDPYERPMPNGKESPQDVAEKSGAERAPEAHKAAELAAKTAEDAAKAGVKVVASRVRRPLEVNPPKEAS